MEDCEIADFFGREKEMRKWILSIMFAICMVIILMPQAALAANDDTTELQSKLTAGGTVKLEKD